MRLPLLALLTLAGVWLVSALAIAAGDAVAPVLEQVASTPPGLTALGVRFALVCAAISMAIKMLRIGFPVWAERGPDGRTTLRSKRLTMGTALALGLAAGLLGMIRTPQPGVEWEIVAGLLATSSTLFGHHALTSMISSRLAGKPGIGEDTKRHQERNAKAAGLLSDDADPTKTNTFPGLGG